MNNLDEEDSVDIDMTSVIEGDELLIHMIKARPFLDNKKLNDYRDTRMKENAWTEIAEVLNTSSNFINSIWHLFIPLRQYFFPSF